MSCDLEFNDQQPLPFYLRRSNADVKAKEDSNHNLMRLLETLFSPLNDNANFWWREMGQTVANLMNQADYDLDSLVRNLIFVRNNVVGWMGPKPPHDWKSYICDDHSPVEYSWSWNGSWKSRGDKPKIRLVFEPNGPDSGSSSDPLNLYMVNEFMKEVQHVTNVDFEIHDHFVKMLTCSLPHQTATMRGRVLPALHRSSMVVGIEFEDEGATPTIKTYYMPLAKALETNQTQAKVVFDAIQSFNRTHRHQYLAFDELLKYISNDPLGSKAECEIVAIDCVETSKSRVKLYLRSQDTSWTGICQLMTLNGTLPVSSQALERMREMWCSVLSIDITAFSNDLQMGQSHQEPDSGIFVCYYARPDEELRSKFFIPVKYYARDDEAVMEGLTRCIRRQDQTTVPYIDCYRNVVKQICSFRSLDQGCGIHSWISCEPHGNELAITSYFSPEINHPSRNW